MVSQNNEERISIDRLNDCIESVKRNMNPNISYDFLEQIARVMVQKINKVKRPGIIPVLFFDREKAISIVLDFFKSTNNEEWYDKAKNIILGQDPDIGINIFDFDDIDDISGKDENGLHKYSNGSQMEYKQEGPKALVKILLKEDFRDVYREIPKDKFTIEDIYSIVHEISHTFDLGTNIESREARRLFAEIIPHCFENMLGEYLVDKNICAERVIDKINDKRMGFGLRHARAVCAKMELVKLKEKENVLTKDNIKRILEENGIHDYSSAQEILRDVLETIPTVDYDIRYPIAELTAYNYMKLYHGNKKSAIEILKKYCEEMKNGNMNDEKIRLVGCPTNLEEVERTAKNIGDSRNI